MGAFGGEPPAGLLLSTPSLPLSKASKYWAQPEAWTAASRVLSAVTSAVARGMAFFKPVHWHE